MDNIEHEVWLLELDVRFEDGGFVEDINDIIEDL